MTKTKLIFLIILITSFSLSFALPVLAQNWFGGEPLIPEVCTGSHVDANVNKCGLAQVFQVIIGISRIILALTGSATLLMFAYGGVMWIIAAGNQERIQKGKAAMQAAVIGLIFVLGAYLIVNFTICALSSGSVGCDAAIFSRPFAQEPTGIITP